MRSLYAAMVAGILASGCSSSNQPTVDHTHNDSAQALFAQRLVSAIVTDNLADAVTLKHREACEEAHFDYSSGSCGTALGHIYSLRFSSPTLDVNVTITDIEPYGSFGNRERLEVHVAHISPTPRSNEYGPIRYVCEESFIDYDVNGLTQSGFDSVFVVPTAAAREVYDSSIYDCSSLYTDSSVSSLADSLPLYRTWGSHPRLASEGLTEQQRDFFNERFEQLLGIVEPHIVD